jgi:5-methylcytosine-specific restriction endonuclease McrA
MHIEHLIPLASGGSSGEENLWLACAWCNSFKAAKTHAIDPETGEEAPLFNPRLNT